jgi:molecular chaperone DnaK (HSP70)
MAAPRYIVGIDLGTTHTVVASADTSVELDEGEAPKIESFRVDQLVAPGEIAPRDMLPSVRYHPADGQLGPGETVLPWSAEGEGEDAVVGQLALELGAKVPGRLVASAKSWLSHDGVDRTADILPWGAPEEVPKVSPVEASASYLRHVAAAWHHAHPKYPLASQEIMLTVPASFDEGARALTLDAAKRAGLDRVRLVEEPQAAMYQWLDRHRDVLEESLEGVHLAVVVDVGGGTTDLTLIKVELRESGPRLTRIAVGDHLMLGGDNMDLALARVAEPRVAGAGASAGTKPQLGASRFSQLIQQARHAKEQLLSADAPEHTKITVLGSGSKLIGGARSTDVTREEVETLVLDGFFPKIAPDARPEKRRGAIVEFGLPYVADAGITRHVAAFLAHHDELARDALGIGPDDGLAIPDAVLLNGGVFRGDALATRLIDVLGEWRGEMPKRLENEAPELAVARGAVAYGLARRGMGLRIGGGSARSYFLVLPEQKGEEGRKGVCVLPRGAEEGEDIELERRSMSLRLGKPVRFPLVATSQDVRHHRPGDIIDISGESYHDLPLMAAVLESDDPSQKDVEIPVKVITALTEVGTLEMSCVAEEDTKRRWKLEMALRGASAKEVAAQKVTQLHPRFKEATDLIRRIFGKSTEGVKPSEIKQLRNNLEKVIGARGTWDTPLLRELYGALFANVKRRRRSDAHERIWLNLAGYTLRPGFGYPLDDWRVKELWSLWKSGIQYVPESQNWAEWWIMWRRVAGGLSPEMQEKILGAIEWYLHPPTKRPRKRPAGPKMAGYDDMVRLAGSLEHVSPPRKVQIGDWLMKRLLEHDENTQTWWALGRLGARVPFYGSAHAVVPRADAERWLSACLGADFAEEEQAAFAAAVLCRVSGDRQRDLGEAARKQVAERLSAAGAPEAWQRMVLEVTHLDEAEERRIFGESLPPGLRLLD